MTVPSYAQFSMKVGGVTGLNFNIHNGADLSTTGSGIGFIIGGEADIMFNQQIGILARVLFYDNLSASFSPQSQEDVYVSIAYLTIDPMFKLKLKHSNFFFFGGPTLGINVEASQEVDYNGQKVPEYSGNLKQMSMRFGIKVGSGVDLPVGGGVYITPEFSFGYGLTKVQSDVSWRIMSFFLGSAVKFDI